MAITADGSIKQWFSDFQTHFNQSKSEGLFRRLTGWKTAKSFNFPLISISCCSLLKVAVII